ncbi:hypothetical protein NUACC21_60510 [Scytonema sp. NUACC21]
MVERFIRRFDESYLKLAYYAALPLVLTPELLNFLRVQFLRGKVHWVAEVDLLLSDLCSQVGYELYAMDTAVRDYLLEDMSSKLPEAEQQMQEVAKALISYVKYLAQTNPYVSPQELQAQQWSAMVYLNTQREKAVSEIAQAFDIAASQKDAEGRLCDRTEMLRLARITEELAPQLKKYRNLVKYAQVVTQVLTNPSKVKQEDLHRSYPVAQAKLSIPPELVPGGEKPKSSSPRLQEFEFEVATVQVEKKTKEIVINRRPGRAKFFVEDLGNGITLEMVDIPGGTFTMGAPKDEEGSKDRERPQHQVTIKPFFMGKYPVTQAQWKAVAALPKVERDLKPAPSHFKGDDRPVECVSWFDAMEFCARLSKYSGREYRLPSEAEWEYACRAGTTTPFHFGETINTDLANYNGTDDKDGKRKGSYWQGPLGEYRQQTTKVGIFPANAFGLYDMHGNVWEWCADDWHSNYEAAPSDGGIWIKNNNDNQIKLLRGGSWYDNPEHCRSAYRNDHFPDNDFNDFNGFRVVCGFAPRT